MGIVGGVVFVELPKTTYSHIVRLVSISLIFLHDLVYVLASVQHNFRCFYSSSDLSKRTRPFGVLFCKQVLFWPLALYKPKAGGAPQQAAWLSLAATVRGAETGMRCTSNPQA